MLKIICECILTKIHRAVEGGVNGDSSLFSRIISSLEIGMWPDFTITVPTRGWYSHWRYPGDDRSGFLSSCLGNFLPTHDAESERLIGALETPISECSTF